MTQHKHFIDKSSENLKYQQHINIPLVTCMLFESDFGIPITVFIKNNLDLITFCIAKETISKYLKTIT